MLTIISAKSAVIEQVVVQKEQPRKFILELNEKQMKLLVALQARLYCDGTQLLSYKEWSDLDDEFFQNNYPDTQNIKEIHK